MTYEVTWKNEDFISGQPVGPCNVIDLEAAQSDPVLADMPFGMPYGYKPTWKDDRGWMTLAQAELIAAEHGVTLKVW